MMRAAGSHHQSGPDDVHAHAEARQSKSNTAQSCAEPRTEGEPKERAAGGACRPNAPRREHLRSPLQARRTVEHANARLLPAIHQLVCLAGARVMPGCTSQARFHGIDHIFGMRSRLGEAQSTALARNVRANRAVPILPELRPTPGGVQNAHRHAGQVLDQVLRQRGSTMGLVRQVGSLGCTRAHRDAAAVESEASSRTAVSVAGPRSA